MSNRPTALLAAAVCLLACAAPPAPGEPRTLVAADSVPVAPHRPAASPQLAAKSRPPALGPGDGAGQGREGTIFDPARTSAADASCVPLKTELPELTPVDPALDVPVPPIVDASGYSLARFYGSLARLLRRRSKDHLRIGVYGDSNLTRDQLTGWLRRRLQEKYGDAGHGYVAAARPWEWYLHTDVGHGFAARAWTAYACSTNPAPDRFYGFAGISAESRQRGASSYVETAGTGAPVGRAVSQFEVYFLKRPRNGSFSMLVDGVPKAIIDTDSPYVEAGFYRIDVPDGPHRLDIVTLDQRKPVRLFGTTLERGTPGIVIDSLGVGGASCPAFVKQDHAVATASLRHRRYDLVVFALLSNYSDQAQLPQCMKSLIELQRDALPGVPIVLFGPPDYTDPTKPPVSTSPLTIKRGLAIERIARDNKAAFWDFRAAMGGELSILRFRSHRLVWTDHIHLTDKGAQRMADRFAFALWKGLMDHIASNPEAGCEGG